MKAGSLRFETLCGKHLPIDDLTTCYHCALDNFDQDFDLMFERVYMDGGRLKYEGFLGYRRKGNESTGTT